MLCCYCFLLFLLTELVKNTDATENEVESRIEEKNNNVTKILQPSTEGLPSVRKGTSYGNMGAKYELARRWGKHNSKENNNKIKERRMNKGLNRLKGKLQRRKKNSGKKKKRRKKNSGKKNKRRKKKSGKKKKKRRKKKRKRKKKQKKKQPREEIKFDTSCECGVTPNKVK